MRTGADQPPDGRQGGVTGGVDTARHVVANTAHNLARSPWIGRQSPILVFDDATSMGRKGGSRELRGVRPELRGRYPGFFVQSGVHERFVDEVVRRAEAIRMATHWPTTRRGGPLATRAQRDRIEAVVAESSTREPPAHRGCRPEGLGRVVLPAHRAGVRRPRVRSTRVNFWTSHVGASLRHEDEAVALANDTELGWGPGSLPGTCPGSPGGQGHPLGHRLGQHLPGHLPIAPFGGFGNSGSGREAGVDAIHEFTTTKNPLDQHINRTDVQPVHYSLTEDKSGQGDGFSRIRSGDGSAR
ncbi:MAG: hypothetical protein Ct9H300mP31_16600 [Acidimicrobiaceae bacterium]|nr:MAG: hypothetical protein Ct9H300mP31_16600 [Acidimicrobiaceae bacterium]